jgi:tetratricopeptide (TPR) repeat protein/O-antigen ligase
VAADPQSSARARRIVRRGIAAVSLVSPLIILPGLYQPARLPQAAAVQLGAAVLLWLWLMGGGRPWRTLHAQPGRALLAFVSWAGFSVFWSLNRYEGLLVWASWAAGLAAYAVAVDMAREPADLEQTLVALFAAGVLVSMVGLAQALLGLAALPQAMAPAATFVNRNVAAQFVVAVLPFGLVAAQGTSRARALALSGAALILVYLALTRTRSAAVALGLQAILLLVIGGRRYASQTRTAGRWIPVGVAGVLVAALLAGIVAMRVRAAAEAATAAPLGAAVPPAAVASVAGRLAIWRNTLALVGEHPVAGVGIGNHRLAYPLYANRIVADPLYSDRTHLDFAHNDYVQATAETGLVGLGLLAWVALAMTATARAALRAAEPAGTMAVAASLTLVGLSADALFSFPAYMPLPPWIAGLAAATLTVAAGARTPAPVPPRGSARGALIVAGALGVGLFAHHHLRILRADGHVFAMNRAEARHDWDKVLQESRQATALDPGRPEPYFLRGQAGLARGDAKDAAAAFERALARTPNDMNALANLGLAASTLGDRARAIECWRRVVAIRPAEARAQYQLGHLLESTGDAEGALQAYRLAAIHDPYDARAEQRRGLLALRLGRRGEAEGALRSALRRAPRSAESHKAMGVLLLADPARRVEAVHRFEEALRLDPQIANHEQMRRIVAGAAPPAP